MTPTLVLCEGAAKPRSVRLKAPDTLELNQSISPANIRIKIENISQSILRELRARTRDLLRIAAYIYGADTSVKRGTPKDVYADEWARTFHFVIPVEDLAHWLRPDVKSALVEVLRYATGDIFSFEFVKGGPREGQIALTFGEGAAPKADLVTLFSGGLDSLAAVIEQVGKEGRKPVLVSHRSVPKIDSRQQRLVSLLKERYSQWSFPHVSVWAHRQLHRAVENSQRSRGFLYLVMGTAVAAELGIKEVRICDNGVMSVNLPRLSQTVGTMATRSTHPMFLQRFEELARLTFDAPIRISNPFLTKTRFEVVELIRDASQADLIQETVSCFRTEGMTDFQPHCGTCTQCVDRRFATLAVGVEEHDLPSRYEKDVFIDPLDEGEERAYAESYVRAATLFSKLSDVDFYINYPELQECVVTLPGPTDQAAWALIDLHRRHATSVLDVIKTKMTELSDRLVNGDLPDSCLVALVAGREHLKDNCAAYARRLGRLMEHHVPKAFRSRAAADEPHLQDIAEAVLGAAQQPLRREFPLLPFGAVTTKPDFSDANDPLFVEMKYPRNRGDLRRISTEMTSRVVIYRDQGASVLFVVYDPNRTILDDQEFVGAYERHERVWVAMVR